MRKKIVAGNWKMNNSFQQAEELIKNLLELVRKNEIKKSLMILCPPFPYLKLANDLTKNTTIAIGAQNVSQYENGAYTGEVSASMLKSLGVKFCIIGHSERRKYFYETSAILKEKLDILIKYDIQPIFCCGEQLADREKSTYLNIVKTQIKEALFQFTANDFKKIIIAYEPVWAIGTGKTASPEKAQEMHSFIRNLLVEKYGKKIADTATILYGGSCNSKNSKELFAKLDVDGGLIGGASLNAIDFYQIYNSF